MLTGKLADSGDFHASSYSPDGPIKPDGGAVSFVTPSGNIVCTGSSSWLTCDATSRELTRPPVPVEKPPGNWEPYIELGSDKLTYGVAAGNPLVPVHANTLPYGSTLRFGDIECLSATDGITCVDFQSSIGFHLSRDDLTPLKAVDPVPVDTRVEPRTPGNEFCGALVSDAAILAAGKSLPNNGGLTWTDILPSGRYTCNHVQLFMLSSVDSALHHEIPYLPTYVLVFDRGRFVASVTDHPYPGLQGEMDARDPTLIRLTFHTLVAGKAATADVRARYQNGAIMLLDPIPEGAIPSA